MLTTEIKNAKTVASAKFFGKEVRFGLFYRWHEYVLLSSLYRQLRVRILRNNVDVISVPSIINSEIISPMKVKYCSSDSIAYSNYNENFFKWIRRCITFYYVYIAYYGLFVLDFSTVDHPCWRNLEQHWWKCITVWNVVSVQYTKLSIYYFKIRIAYGRFFYLSVYSLRGNPLLQQCRLRSDIR